tara:strand:- start:159 stop:299 length:141 start_codon:yes stop_codon:yes gene_type:complete
VTERNEDETKTRRRERAPQGSFGRGDAGKKQQHEIINLIFAFSRSN